MSRTTVASLPQPRSDSGLAPSTKDATASVPRPSARPVAADKGGRLKPSASQRLALLDAKPGIAPETAITSGVRTAPKAAKPSAHDRRPNPKPIVISVDFGPDLTDWALRGYPAQRLAKGARVSAFASCVEDSAPTEIYTPSDAQIAHHLAGFITFVRSLSIDPVVVRENWLKAYTFAGPSAATTLSEYARENDPFAAIGRRSRTVDVVSIVRVSGESFQGRWIEKTYEGGALTGAKRFTGVFTITLQPPKDAETLRANPLGLYVRSLSWSEDLVTGER